MSNKSPINTQESPKPFDLEHLSSTWRGGSNLVHLHFFGDFLSVPI
nr:MAG TPA: hypothetical protein [Ackermannviridae sp.]